MAAQPHIAPMSADEYLAWERDSQEKHEYIDGRITLMSGGTADHSAICLNVSSTLRALLRGDQCRAYTSDMRVRLSETRYVYPDVSVSCDPRDRGRIQELQVPNLIVEVLSPKTEAHDRGDKFGYYRDCPAVQEYVLVNTGRPEVEVFRRAGAFWTLTTFEQDNEAELASLGIRLPLAEVYDGIEFPEPGADA